MMKGDSTSKGDTLLRFAEFYAAADPETALSLTQNIKDVDTDSKDNVLYHVAVTWAATNPQQAFEIVDTIVGQHWKADARFDIFLIQAKTEPEQASYFFQQALQVLDMMRDTTHDSALAKIAGAMANTNFEHADQIARSIHVQNARDQALWCVAVAIARGEDPGNFFDDDDW